MSTTIAQVKTVASEFSTLSDDVIQSYIDIAENYVSLDYWGTEKFDFIHALMTAHIMKQMNVAGTGGAGGTVSSERLGDIAVSYGVTATALDDLASTSYGALIKQLRRSILKTPIGY